MDEFVSGQPHKNLVKEIQNFLNKNNKTRTLTSIDKLLKRKENDT